MGGSPPIPFLIGGGTRRRQARVPWRSNGSKGRKGCTLTHLANVLAGAFMGPCGFGNHIANPTYRREPEARQWLGANRWPGGPLNSHLQFPKDGTLNGRRNSKRCLWFWPGWGRLGLPLGFLEGMGFDTRPPFVQILQHLTKTSFLPHQPLPLEFPYWWW